jgi:hypothetical protein
LTASSRWQSASAKPRNTRTPIRTLRRASYRECPASAAGQNLRSSGVVLDGEGGRLGFLLLAPLVQALLSGR